MTKKGSNIKTKVNLKSLRVYLLLCFCGILAVFTIFLTIDSATSGSEIADLQKKEALLVARQQDLQESLVENLSVSSLQEKSGELGFTKINNLVYVADGIPVAILP